MSAIPAAHLARDQRRAAFEALLAALDRMGEGLVVVEKQKLSYANAKFRRLCGYTEAELAALPSFLDLLQPAQRPAMLQRYQNAGLGAAEGRVETVLQHRDGRSIDAELAITVMHNGERSAIVITVRDICQRKQTELELARHRDLLAQRVEQYGAELALEQRWAQVTLAAVADAVISTDGNGMIVCLNPAAERLCGWTASEARGRRAGEVVRLFEECSRRPAPDALCLHRDPGETPRQSADYLLRRRDGREVAVEVAATPIPGQRQELGGFVVVLRDLSEQRQLSRQLSHQATHDALTGLANRHAFEQRLRLLVEDANTNDRTHALFYLDLDQFKVVNDTCGHVAGDELLRQLGQQLQQRLRRGDTLARLGGDEFGVLLDNCPPEQALRVAENLLKTIREFRFNWTDKTFSVGACIGVVGISRGTDSMTSALRAADTACFAAKDKGRNRIHHYQADDVELNRRQGEMLWVAHINSALEENRFCLFYQPIVALQAGGTAEEHWEILVRLKDPDGKIIAPGFFIPAAERYNLMPAIDRWVIRNVIAWCARRLHSLPGRTLPVCGINLSGVSFGDQSLVAFIREALAEHGVPPSCLCFEITETAAIANISEAVAFIGELKQLGCRFALDDFGSGMSSFAYLKNLPVDFLKIDGNFVRDIAEDPIDYAMVEAINRVGQVMGIRTIAEYVENDDIRDRLAGLGVDFGQGYGIARPAPMDDDTGY